MERLFTIGHSNHPPAAFFGLLAQHGISALADVRSHPYSQYLPEYNRPILEATLRDLDIAYVFLGQELGARRSEENCYVNGVVHYNRIAALPLFSKGLERLFQGITNYTVALMCAEADPLTCHRTILICREIRKRRPDLPIVHILTDGTTETHEEAEERLVALHKLQPELFGDLTTMAALIEKAYALQAEKIEYQKGMDDA